MTEPKTGYLHGAKFPLNTNRLLLYLKSYADYNFNVHHWYADFAHYKYYTAADIAEL